MVKVLTFQEMIDMTMTFNWYMADSVYNDHKYFVQTDKPISRPNWTENSSFVGSYKQSDIYSFPTEEEMFMFIMSN